MKFYGTKVDFVPCALANHQVRVDLSVALSAIDEARSVTSGDLKIPAVKVMEFNTRFESRLGETLVCGGLTQERAFPASAGEGKHDNAGTVRHQYRQLILITPEAATEAIAAQRPSAVR